MSRLLVASTLFLLACGAPSHAPSAEPIRPSPPPTASSPPPPIASAAPPPSTGSSAPPPAPDPGSVAITLGYPRVSAKAPVMTLVLFNHTREPFHFTEVAGAPCQLASLLAFSMKSVAGKVLPMAPCVPSPGIDRTVAPGAKVQLALPLTELYPRLENGTYEITAEWVTGKAGASVGPQRQLSSPGQPLTIRPVLRSFVIKRGETAQLAGGATLMFAGNSHKDVDAESAPSPLIIEGRLTPAGGKPDTFYIHVQPERSRVFAVGDHYFELGDYEYGVSMHLKYFGELH